MRIRILFAARAFGVGSLAAAALSLAGCAESPPSDVAEPRGPDAIAAPVIEDGGAPRRPLRRYYMTRTELRCEVYFIEGDAISTPLPAPCPAYIDVGERVRLSGRSCFREGVPAREQPVICPAEIIDMEASERARKASEADGGAGDAGARDSGRR